MTHELKNWTEFFEDMMAEGKNFEIRRNDRNFQVGDLIIELSKKPSPFPFWLDLLVFLETNHTLAEFQENSTFDR